MRFCLFRTKRRGWRQIPSSKPWDLSNSCPLNYLIWDFAAALPRAMKWLAWAEGSAFHYLFGTLASHLSDNTGIRWLDGTGLTVVATTIPATSSGHLQGA